MGIACEDIFVVVVVVVVADVGVQDTESGGCILP